MHDLAAALPSLQGLQLLYLQPNPCTVEALTQNSSVTLMGGWMLPGTLPVTVHSAVPGCVYSCVCMYVRLCVLYSVCKVEVC